MARTAGPATVITRRQIPVTYAAGAKQVIQLTRGLAYREMYLHLTATPTLTAANNTAAKAKLGDEWGSITKIELIANGTTTLFSMAGSDLRMFHMIMASSISDSSQVMKVSSNLGDVTTANPILDSTVVVPFLNPRSTRPFDTLLYTGEMSDLRLEVTWATDWTSINGSATAWTTQPLLEVYTREQTLPVNPTSGQPILPNFYRRVLKVPITIAAANSAYRYQLNTGPIYRGFVINGLNGTPIEAVGTFTNVRLFSGPTTFMDIGETTLYSAGNWKAKIPFGQVPQFTTLAQVAVAQGNLDVSTARIPGSWYWMDLADDGYMTEALDTDSIGDTFLEFNTPAAATINILSNELLRINRGGTGGATASA